MKMKFVEPTLKSLNLLNCPSYQEREKFKPIWICLYRDMFRISNRFYAGRDIDYLGTAYTGFLVAFNCKGECSTQFR